ncbi:MAG: cell division topological specificity factor MinE [Anaerolineaceae bacterium]|jgi:cell division topological specificity factor
MASWLDRLTGGAKAKSAHSAKERLKLVLIHDRTDISPKDMEDMKNELLKVISRYVEIDPQAVRIDMQQEGREQRLVADIPLKVVTRR